jgi:hypothetical protein
MDHNKATEVIRAYAEKHGVEGGLLEQLTAMKADDALTNLERHAFNFIFDGMRRLFHGDD